MQNRFIQDIYLIILVICFIGSLSVYYRNTAYKFLNLFPPFTFLTLVIEVFGAALNSVEYNQVYNYFWTIEFNFYFFVLSRISKNPHVKKALLLSMFAYTIFHLMNLIFIQGVKYPGSYSMNFGGLLVVIFSGICLIELFQSKNSTRIFSNPAFWICLGLITYYACSFPMWAAIYLMIEIPAEDREAIIIAHFLTNYILYLSFTMSFLCEVVFKKPYK